MGSGIYGQLNDRAVDHDNDHPGQRCISAHNTCRRTHQLGRDASENHVSAAYVAACHAGGKGRIEREATSCPLNERNETWKLYCLVLFFFARTIKITRKIRFWREESSKRKEGEFLFFLCV